MIHLTRSGYFFALFFLVCASGVVAGPLSDSLFIQGCYTQNGHPVRRGKLEKFLLAKDTSARLTDASLGLKWSGHALGVTLWCVNAGVFAYQLKGVTDAYNKQEPISNNLDRLTIPLVVGSGITSFIQNLLYNRSDYLLHRAVVNFNNSIAGAVAPESALDHHIEKAKNGWYEQDRALFPERILYSVLREKPASRTFSNYSIVLREAGDQALGIGVMFIALAAISYMEQDSLVNTGKREINLRIGIGVTSFGIINTIIAAVIKNAAIDRYNATLPDLNVFKACPAKQPDSAGKTETANDTAGTGNKVTPLKPYSE